jgi:hypothetical protein
MRHSLYFIDSYGRYRLLGVNMTESEAMLAIDDFLKEHHYVYYYIRKWNTEEGVKYDVGSHTEFFMWGEHDA